MGGLGGGGAGRAGALGAVRRGGNMPRSFLVDSLVLREAAEKKAPEGSPPLFPYAVPPPHALHGLSPGCHARKAGLLCVCPLCVTASQLHGPPGPPALPLLKASFPPFASQYCHAPLGRQHSAVSPGVAHGPAAAAAAAALYQTPYPLPDPRQFHCLSVGKPGARDVHWAPRGAGQWVRVLEGACTPASLLERERGPGIGSGPWRGLAPRRLSWSGRRGPGDGPAFRGSEGRAGALLQWGPSLAGQGVPERLAFVTVSVSAPRPPQTAAPTPCPAASGCARPSPARSCSS